MPRGASVLTARPSSARGAASSKHSDIPIRALRPGCAHTGGEGREKQGGVDPVHQKRQPASARRAEMIGQIAAQKRQMRLAPARNYVVVVAIGHRAAHHQRQRLAERVRHPPGAARVVDDRKMIKQRLQARSLFECGKGKAHGGGSRIAPPPSNQTKRNPLAAINLSSRPWLENRRLATKFAKR